MVLGLIEAILALKVGAGRNDETGAVSAEYALLLVFIALVTITGLTALAIAVNGLLEQGATSF
jgi:Flp pilus assembly pilin Flp